MALINCPECGKEISDKAGRCPNCGFPIEITKNESNINNKETENIAFNDIECMGNKKNDISTNAINNKKTLFPKRYIPFGASILSILLFILIFCLPERYVTLGNIVLFLNIIPVLIGIVSIFKIPKGEKGRWGGLIGIILSGVVLCLSVVAIFDGDSQNIYEEKADIEKIETITKFLGEKVNIKTNSLDMPQEMIDFLDNAKLFEYYGFVSHSYSTAATAKQDQGEIIIDIAEWKSKNQYNNTMFEKIITQLIGIYGETNIDENALDDYTGEYVWRNVGEFSFIICGKSDDNKVGIRWMIDIETENSNKNTQSSSDSEEFEMFTVYEGKYDAEAKQYEEFAEKCFLAELDSSEKNYVEQGGKTLNSLWEFSGSFKQNGNYYYCYRYSFTAHGTKSHVLIKYDVNTGETSVETPLEWIQADIDATEEKLNN